MAQESNDDYPETISALIEAVGTSQQYKSALWSPRAEFTMEVSSFPNLIRTRDQKSNHFYFSNQYCIILSEEFSKPEALTIKKGSRYLFKDIFYTKDALSSTGKPVTQIDIRLMDKYKTVKNLEINCSFPKGYLDLNSHPSLIFDGGLEGLLKYLPSILF
jgi:hypothetical protein